MKLKLILLLLILLIPSTLATTTITSFLENLDSNYIVLVEDSAPGSDSLAATDIITGILRESQNTIILQSKLASENSQSTNLILIGHPCDNKLIPIDCNSWSYRNGESIIQVIGSNLIISGTTAEDTRRAAKIVANYKDYLELNQKDKIIVKGASLELPQIILQEQKTQEQMTCGDNICESGEICDKDCKKVTCDEECLDQEYIGGICRSMEDSKCQSGEKLIGTTYCKENTFCCCIEEVEEEQLETIKVTKKPGFFRRILNWFKNIF